LAFMFNFSRKSFPRARYPGNVEEDASKC